MLEALPDLTPRIQACLGGAARAAGAGQPALLQELLVAAEATATGGRLDSATLRQSGLTPVPAAGPAAMLLRALPFGLLHANDRPRIRRSAYRCAVDCGADEGTAMVAVATALLAADLLRWDLDTALARVHQTLLEEAPNALLRRLVADDAETGLTGGDADPTRALQLAITGLARATGVAEVMAALSSAQALADVTAPVSSVSPLFAARTDGPAVDAEVEATDGPEGEARPDAADEAGESDREDSARPVVMGEPPSSAASQSGATAAVTALEGDAPGEPSAWIGVAPILAAALAGLRDGHPELPADHPLAERIQRDAAALAAAAARRSASVPVGSPPGQV